MSGPPSAAAAAARARAARLDEAANGSPKPSTGGRRGERGGGDDERGGDDDDDDDDAMTLDPHMLPMELSAHWTGFFSEIFTWRNTVMPSLLPQICVAVILGLFANWLKGFYCDPSVVAAAECETTFDITGHQVVSVSLGFLLVFRTDWAYDRYYEGKQSLGHLYSGLRNLNVCFVNYLRANKPGEKPASELDGALRGVGRTGDEQDAAAARRIEEDRAELLRLTNMLYATMRHILRDLRVGAREGGEPMTDEECVKIGRRPGSRRCRTCSRRG